MLYTKIQTPTLLFLIAAISSLFTAGCKEDKPVTQEELITRVQVHLTSVASNTFDQEFEAKDPDGDGIFNTIEEIVIPVGTTLKCHLHVYDDSQTPVVDLTTEIEAENTAHLFTFKPNITGLGVNNLSKDDSGAPFGLESVWTTANLVGTGTMQIKLIHEPTDKNATDPGGDTDFEVTFPVKIQ